MTTALSRTSCAQLGVVRGCHISGCTRAGLLGHVLHACHPRLPHGTPPLRRYEFKQAKSKGATGAKLLFKKRMFRETDETVTEPQFVNLSYIQAQHDYLQVRGWLAGCRPMHLWFCVVGCGAC